MKIRFFAIFFLLFGFSLVAQNSQNEVSLLDEAQKQGITLYWDTLSQTGLLEKNSHQFSFRVGENLVMLDNVAIKFLDEPTIKDGKIIVTKDFFDVATEHLNQATEESGFKIGAILIDPGHGGKDPGASGNFKVSGKSLKVQEKDVVLSIGKSLFSKLKQAYPNKKIILTRDTDKFLTLAERTDIANHVNLKDKEAILYVSIHANASLDKKASGYEVWYLSPGYRRTVLDKKDVENDASLFPILNSMMEEEFTTESILMSKFIMDALQVQIGDKSKQRGIKAEEWFVVKNANMPSVLVEVGFVTNEKEAINLNDSAYLNKTALGIYNGIQAFVTHFERSRGFTQ